MSGKRKIIFTVSALLLMLTIIGCSIEMGITASDTESEGESSAGISISIEPETTGSRLVSSEAFSAETLTVVITDEEGNEAGSVYWTADEGSKTISYSLKTGTDFEIKIIQPGKEEGEKKTVTETTSLYTAETESIELKIVTGYAAVIE